MKKVISSKSINHGMFFLNSLSIQHQKIKQKINNPIVGFIMNLIYHFSRLNSSFHLEDLIGLPDNMEFSFMS
jgi:hypothetical protein